MSYTEVIHDHNVKWFLREAIAVSPGYRNRAGVQRRDHDVPTEVLAVGDVLHVEWPGEPSFPAKLVERRWEYGVLYMVVAAVPEFEFEPVPELVPVDYEEDDRG